MYARYEHTYVHAYICVRRLFVYIYVYSRVYIYVNVCVYVRVREKGDADSTSTYVNTYGRYIGIGTCIPGGVPFGRRQWAFDTTRSIERLVFSVSQRYLSGKDKRALYRMPEKYFYIDSLPYVYVYMYVHARVTYEGGMLQKALLRLSWDTV